MLCQGPVPVPRYAPLTGSRTSSTAQGGRMERSPDDTKGPGRGAARVWMILLVLGALLEVPRTSTGRDNASDQATR